MCYFETTTSPCLVWARLLQFDFTAEAGPRKLDLIRQPDRYGDVSADFMATEPFRVRSSH